MKKIFLFIFILAANYSTAQIYVNQKNINTTGHQYIEVWEKYNNKTDKFVAMVDYGQALNLDNSKSQLKMHDGKGKVLEFNSVIAILNYFYLNGWELVHVKKMKETESYLLQKRKKPSSIEKSTPTTPSIGSN